MTNPVKTYYLQGEHYDWTRDPKLFEKLFHWNRARILLQLLGHTNSIILDLGCGTGLITRHLDAIGIDLNLWNLKHLTGSAIQADIEHLPFKREIADLIVCTEVLEHLSKPSHAIREIGRLLKIPGRLIGSVPSSSPIWKLRRLLSLTHPHSEPFHRNYTPAMLHILLGDHFQRVKITAGNFGMTLFFSAEWPHNGV